MRKKKDQADPGALHSEPSGFKLVNMPGIGHVLRDTTTTRQRLQNALNGDRRYAIEAIEVIRQKMLVRIELEKEERAYLTFILDTLVTSPNEAAKSLGLIRPRGTPKKSQLNFYRIGRRVAELHLLNGCPVEDTKRGDGALTLTGIEMNASYAQAKRGYTKFKKRWSEIHAWSREAFPDEPAQQFEDFVRVMLRDGQE